MDVTEVRIRIAENVKVLLAIRGLSQRSLALSIGWAPEKVGRLFKGQQEWTLPDLITIGTTLGLSDPFLLTRPLEAVVHELDPNGRSATGTSGGSLWCDPGHVLAPVLAFPLAARAVLDVAHSATILPFQRSTHRHVNRHPTHSTVRVNRNSPEGVNRGRKRHTA